VATRIMGDVSTMQHARSQPVRPIPPSCACNGEALELVVTAPRVGPFPELRTYRCDDCGHVVTVESE
jgi:hypothetical protein